MTSVFHFLMIVRFIPLIKRARLSLVTNRAVYHFHRITQFIFKLKTTCTSSFYYIVILGLSVKLWGICK